LTSGKKQEIGALFWPAGPHRFTTADASLGWFHLGES